MAKVGRPHEGTPENVKSAEEYVKHGWEKLNEKFPTVAGLSLWLHISRETLYERQEFSDILGKIKSLQEMALISHGLAGDYNPTIAKLLLASKHGYVEQTDVTSGGEKINFNNVIPRPTEK